MKTPDIYPRTCIPKVGRYSRLAGLLTHSLHRPSHAHGTVVEEMVTSKYLRQLTVAGTVLDSHQVPF